jgi:hypothetical protein
MPTYYSLGNGLLMIEPDVDKVTILSRSVAFTYVGRIEIPIHLLPKLIDALEEVSDNLTQTEELPNV